MPYDPLKDDDDIHEAEIQVGQDLRGSVVTKVRIEVTETDERFKLKKFIHLLNGIQIISTYMKTKAEGLSDLEKVGEVSLSPVELERLKKANTKDDSAARAKARALLDARKGNKGKPAPPKPKPFQLTVKTPDGRPISVDGVFPTDTVKDIKKAVERKEGIPFAEQHLVFRDKPLENPASTMNDEGIKDGAVLELIEPTFTVQVNTPDGKTIQVPNIKKNDTVRDLKKKIQKQEGIPVKAQWLLHDGKLLEDPDSTMDDNCIEDGSILDMAEPTFTIKVKKPDGKIIKVPDTKKDDTVEDVKKKIEDREGIPVEAQWLLHQGKPLDDPKSTMEDNGIKDDSVLDMVQPSFTVQVNTPDGRTIDVPNVKKGDTVKDLKMKIKDQEGIPIESQWLLYDGEPMDDPVSTMEDNGIKDGSILDMIEPSFTVKVHTPDGNIIEVADVNETDTVKELKEKIEKQEGIPVEAQWLLHDGKPLDDPGSTMKDNSIKNGSTVHMIEPTFSVKVNTPDGTTFVVPDVKKSDKVKDLKKKIQKQEGIPIKAQWLLHDGKPLADPDSTMGDNGIKDGSVLDMVEPTFTVKVRTLDGKTVEIPDVKKSHTVLDLKEKIKDIEGIPVEAQWLLHDGKALDDPDTTMHDHGIQEGSTLDMVEPTFSIKVKTPQGKTITVPDVKSSDTVEDVKKRIGEKEGIPVRDQRLRFKGSPLKDPKSTMKDHNIKEGSLLELAPMQIHVRTPDGRDIPLTVEPSQKIDDVKLMVVAEDDSTPSVKYARLVFKDAELPGMDTLEASKIRHGDVIDLAPMEITVKTPNGERFIVQANPLDKVKNLKKKIAVKENIPVSEQRLIFGDIELDDAPTLFDYDIKHGSMLELDDTIRVKVRTEDGKIIPVEAKPDDLIVDMKKKLESLTDIPLEKQKLAKDGTEIDADDSELRDNGIKDGTILDLWQLRSGMQIHVKKDWDKKQFSLDVTKDDQIADIKKQIQEQEGIPRKKQHLTFAGLALDEKEKKCLHEYGIKQESILNLEKMKIYVRTSTGKFTLSEVQPDTSIRDVKDMVEEKSKIPPKEQDLLFGNVKLDDGGKTLNDYEIRHKSTLTLDMSEDNTPEYDVALGEWQSSFGFVGKDGVKREGKRKKKPKGQYY